MTSSSYLYSREPLRKLHMRLEILSCLGRSTKSFKGALSGLRKFLTTEIPLKMMKYAFYFTLKVFLFSRCLNFCFDLLVMLKKDLIRKIISKFVTSQPN